MTPKVDAVVAREVRESYRLFRRAEITDRGLRGKAGSKIGDRARWLRWRRSHYRAAARRFDRALLALETYLELNLPGYQPSDFVAVCTAVLRNSNRRRP
ncbi:MAG: hypothetical protein ACRCYQ_05370 [Nocardioides sp.]